MSSEQQDISGLRWCFHPGLCVTFLSALAAVLAADDLECAV